MWAVEGVKSGRLKPQFRGCVDALANGLFISVDGVDAAGRHGAGHVLAHTATLALINAAKQHGVAVMSLKAGFHIGRVGTYAEMCTANGLVAMFHTNVVDKRKDPGTGGRVCVLCRTASFPPLLFHRRPSCRARRPFFYCWRMSTCAATLASDSAATCPNAALTGPNQRMAKARTEEAAVVARGGEGLPVLFVFVGRLPDNRKPALAAPTL